MTGYADYIASLLRPLGIYDLTRGTAVSAENYAAGGMLDDLSALLDSVSRDASPAEAEGDALRRWEQLFPHLPPSETPERRRALAALFAVGDRSFTLGALRRCLEVCGLVVELFETDEQQVEIYFPEVAGIPADFDRITASLEMLLPCHLDILYCFHFVTWELWELLFPTFAALDASGQSWREIELIWR